MGSPGTSKVNNTTAPSTSSPDPALNEVVEFLSESHIYNYLDSPPPITPWNATNAAQELPAFNSPLLAFTSPHATSLPNRSQHLRPTSAEISLNDGRDKKAAGGPGEYEKSLAQFCRWLSADTDFDTYTKTQPCLSSGCVDQYLADPLAVDSVNSADSSLNQLIERVSSLNELIDAKKSIKFGDRNGTRKDERTESGRGLHLRSIVNAVQSAPAATANEKLAEASIGGQDGMKAASVISCHPSDLADSYEYNKSSPKKKRKTTLSPNDGGAKHCNCKKTQCLKLYCECFAIGWYCTESCACQGCYNKTDYEDTVLEKRRVIASRNQLAFAPKIEQHTSRFINREVGTRATPSSGRHKIGCNCKKSMCQKKYCECFQANVLCSTRCRCDGCKNVCDKKEGKM